MHAGGRRFNPDWLQIEGESGERRRGKSRKSGKERIREEEKRVLTTRNNRDESPGYF